MRNTLFRPISGLALVAAGALGCVAEGAATSDRELKTECARTVKSTGECINKWFKDEQNNEIWVFNKPATKSVTKILAASYNSDTDAVALEFSWNREVCRRTTSETNPKDPTSGEPNASDLVETCHIDESFEGSLMLTLDVSSAEFEAPEALFGETPPPQLKVDAIVREASSDMIEFFGKARNKLWAFVPDVDPNACTSERSIAASPTLELHVPTVIKKVVEPDGTTSVRIVEHSNAEIAFEISQATQNLSPYLRMGQSIVEDIQPHVCGN